MSAKTFRGSIPVEIVEDWAAAIAPLDNDTNRAAYVSGNIPRADAVKDIDKRYRWDLARAAGLIGAFCEAYDAGFDDANIDTALRFIVQPLVAN
jgi:hypothetical protein